MPKRNSNTADTGEFVFSDTEPDPTPADSDDDSHFKLTRRRAAAGLATIALGSAGVGAGTLALWSDTQTQGVSFDSGSLGFAVGQQQSLTLNVSDLKPTDTGSDYVDLRKATGSTTAGDLSISINNLVSGEGATPSWEANSDTSDGGELDEQLELKLWIGTAGATDTSYTSGTDIGLNADGTTTTTGDGGFEPATNYSGATWNGPLITDFNGPVTFNVEYRFPDQAGNDDAHGDTLTVDFAFTLAQQT